jgi:hypothetical protein
VILVLAENCPIFDSGARAHLQDLLFTIIVKQRHTLASPAPDRLERLLPKDLWEFYREYLIQAQKQSINSHQKWVQSADCSACDAAKLANFCDLPTVLIVENAGTDGEWVKLVIRKLRPRLMRYLNEPYVALELRQAGGIGEIPKELERTAGRYSRARTAQTLPLRVIALGDSDARLPGHPSSQAREVIAVANSLGASAHILLKRTIENYIPDSSLRDYAAQRPDCRSAVDLILRLPGSARDHYPLKTGLSQGEIDAAGNMYPAGTPIAVKMGDFLSDFLSDFGSHVEAHELRRRDGVNELDELLDLLEENL